MELFCNRCKQKHEVGRENCADHRYWSSYIIPSQPESHIIDTTEILSSTPPPQPAFSVGLWQREYDLRVAQALRGFGSYIIETDPPINTENNPDR